tara:strand:- start:198 stop:929 length:732 start_codon:yes stop_codon:yes gene_type:complete
VKKLLLLVSPLMLMGGLTATQSVSAQSNISGDEAEPQRQKAASRFKQNKYRRLGARHDLSFFAQCLVRRKFDLMEDYLSSLDPDIWNEIMSFPDNRTRCASGNMISNFRTMRGAMAESWYVLKYKDAPAPSILAAVPAIPAPDQSVARIMASDEDEKQAVVVDEFAMCVVASAPLDADAYIRTSVNSDDEEEALGEIQPNFGPCAFEGQQLAFNKETLRAAIAFALARKSIAGDGHVAEEASE